MGAAFRAPMLATLALVTLLGAEPALTPPPLEASVPTPIDLSEPIVDDDPDAHGHGWLKHGFALATLGTTFSLAGGIGLGFVIDASARCRAAPRCFDEGGSMFGTMLTAPWLALGVSMLAVAIPLFIKGFRERYPTLD